MSKKKRNQRQKRLDTPPASPPKQRQLGSAPTAVKQSRPVVLVSVLVIAGLALIGLVLHWPKVSIRQSSNHSVIQSSNSPPQFADFAGSEACAKCHQKQYDLWKKSTHGQAGGKPGEAKVIARFDGQPLYFKDAVVTPTIRNGEYIFSVEQEGLPRNEIKVYATVGGGHMYGGGTQSFFEKSADGTARFLPFDFIRRENLWFVQLRNDRT